MIKANIPAGPYADTRSMLEVHAMFRREFALLPALVRDISPGCRARTNIVADHIHLLITILHEHHLTEDEFLWPRLLDRGSAQAAEIAQLMESQHASLAKLMDNLDSELRAWLSSAAGDHGLALAEILDRMIPALSDHMSLEESRAMPMVERYVTAGEWQRMVDAVQARLSDDNLTLVLGMVMYEGLANSPPQPDSSFEELALRVYGSYSMWVHGTATPPRRSG
jgi:hemerythrin-like domain-containing protein